MDDIPKDELRKYTRQFLEEFKSLVFEDGLYVTDRLINRDALLELGLTNEQRKEIVLSISVIEYDSGPIKDHYNQVFIGSLVKKLTALRFISS